jgi:hypothetical protein
VTRISCKRNNTNRHAGRNKQTQTQVERDHTSL